MSSSASSLDAAEERRAPEDKSAQPMAAAKTAKEKFRDVLEEGHAAAGFTMSVALAVGLILGFACPRDRTIPDPYARLSSILGWTYFACWWVGWYPQLIQNYLSKTVVGISFDFSIYNFIGFLGYSSFNCMLFFNPFVRSEYRHEHGGQNSDVRINDVAFSLHCNLMTIIFLAQMLAYEKGGQRVSKVCWGSCAAVALVAGGYLAAMAAQAPGFTALGFLNVLGYVKLLATLVKYIPQIALNHQRRSTDGWNISNALTDMSGGLFSIGQQCLDAYAVQDISILTGDVFKLGLGLLSIAYCLILTAQHYLLYRDSSDARHEQVKPLLSGQGDQEQRASRRGRQRSGQLDIHIVV